MMGVVLVVLRGERFGIRLQISEISGKGEVLVLSCWIEEEH